MTDQTSLVLVANAGDGSISSFRFDGATLERLAVTDGLTGCSTFVVDAAQDLVYAGVKGEPAGIVTLALDRGTGILAPLSRLDLPDGGMNYLALTPGGDGLLGVSYGGGYGISCRVADGAVAEPVSRVAYPNLHSVLPSPDGRFAYLVSLGADLIAQYSIGDDLTLTPLDPPTVAAPAGSGPRHLVIDDARTSVYVLTEFSGQVLHYRRDLEAGSLEFVGSALAVDPEAGLGPSIFGEDPLAHHFIWGADLHLAGDRLWASERTTSTLAALAVSTTGEVSDAEAFVATETQPRGFAVSADGRFLVAAGEKSTTVSLFAISGDRLDLIERVETGRGANWVRFV